jgi:hypothetical protein
VLKKEMANQADIVIDQLGSIGVNVVERLHALQDKGMKELIFVVEIKSDEDQDEITRAKERYGIDHFVAVNNRLDVINPIDVPEDFRVSIHQHYSFFLLTPKEYGQWFGKLRSGALVQEKDG